jgi:hypothetical protein
MDINAMTHQSVVATFWTNATPERTTAKRQADFNQKRSCSERAEVFSSRAADQTGPSKPPERRRLRYENKRADAIKTMVCGK